VDNIQDAADYPRPFVLPPGTPKERVTLQRKAFFDTLKDKHFLAETKKARLKIDPKTGDELKEIVSDPGSLDAVLSQTEENSLRVVEKRRTAKLTMPAGPRNKLWFRQRCDIIQTAHL